MAKYKASLEWGPQICSNYKSAFFAKTKELLIINNFFEYEVGDIWHYRTTPAGDTELQFDYHGYHGGLQIKGPGLRSGWGRL